jgi:hypothetical protein
MAVDERQCEDPPGLSKESASFFEKKGAPPGEAKKLPLTAGRGREVATARRTESFLLLFLKKEALVLCGG